MESQIEATLPKPNDNTTLLNRYKHVCGHVCFLYCQKSLTLQLFFVKELQIIDYLSRQMEERLPHVLYLHRRSRERHNMR